MEHKRSAVKATIGICLVILCALVSSRVVYGLSLIITGSMLPRGESGNYLIGVLVIAGVGSLVIGAVGLCGLVPSFLFMKRNLGGKGDKLTFKEIVLLVLLVAISGSWMAFSLNQQRLNRIAYDKLTQDLDIYEPTPEMIRLMKERITNEFRKHKTLFLTVRYFSPQSDKSVDSESLENYYVEAIGSKNIRNFKWKPKYNFFVVELTEPGYENLRKTKYLQSIYFYDMATYGQYDGFR